MKQAPVVSVRVTVCLKLGVIDLPHISGMKDTKFHIIH